MTPRSNEPPTTAEMEASSPFSCAKQECDGVPRPCTHEREKSMYDSGYRNGYTDGKADAAEAAAHIGEPTHEEVRAAAAAIANARGMRRGVPPISNILVFLPGNLLAEVMEDAKEALKAARGIE